MKKLLLLIILLLSLTACSQEPDATEPPETIQTLATEYPLASYHVDTMYYPARLGAPVLGEDTAAALYGTLSHEAACQQITNVGDALYYLRAMSGSESFTQSADLCRLFCQLLEGDYPEVDSIHFMGGSCEYTVAYVLQDGYYYPLDLYFWYNLDKKMYWTRFNSYSHCPDLETMADKLMAGFPYHGDKSAMTDWVVYTGPEKDFLNYLTTPQYTTDRLEQWAEEGLTLDQWAERISVPADAVRALNVLGYRSMLYDDNQIIGTVQGTNWGGIWNAQKVFDMRSGNCGGTAHIINALLAGDFDEQGYVGYNDNFGGHVFNYFLRDGIYVMCDFVGLFDSGEFGPDVTLDYIVYLGTDPRQYAEVCMASSSHSDPEAQGYIYHLFMYPAEGVMHPKGFDRNSPETSFSNRIWNVLPDIYQEDYVFLFQRDEYPVFFKTISDPGTWPENLR